MFCVSCEKEQPTGAMFCPFCGAKQSVHVTNEEIPAPPTDSAEKPAIINQVPLPPLDFPVTNLEPIYISELEQDWMFRYKNAAAPPPDWTSGLIDIMFSETHVFIQEKAAIKLTLADYAKVAGLMAGTIATFAVPVVGFTAGLTVLAANKYKTKKHPGYGSHDKFSREGLITMFAAGKGMWAARDECEFRALRVWQVKRFLDTHHYFAIIGKFHHISGTFDFAAIKDVGYPEAEYKKELVKKTNCVISRDDKFKVRSEALRSLEGFSEPPISKKLDSNWLK